MENIIKKYYPDFDWIKYKEMNPFLFFYNLKTKEEYMNNFLTEGRYLGRKYKEEHNNNYSIHVLMATIGKDSIFNILKNLKNELNTNDYLTIVFDATKNNYENVLNFVKNIKANVKLIVEEENLGYWGHGIRNKHNILEGDFVYHIDDDDEIVEGSFNYVRQILKDKDTMYIFKIISEINEVIWKSPEIKLNQISTQSGFIPTKLNNKSEWLYKYGGDFYFYKNLEKYINNNNNKIIFIDKIIYKKRLKRK
jgi:hypothetical protein